MRNLLSQSWRIILALTKEDHAQALLEAQGKHGMVDTKFNVKQFLKDDEARNALLDHISSGYSVRAFVEEVGLPMRATTALNRALVRLKAPDPRFEEYQLAKHTRANQFAERMLEMVDKVEAGELTPQQASMMIKTLTWLAARLDPKRWTDRLQIDANLKLDTASSHLAAVREMATMVKADPVNRVIDVEPEPENFDGLLD